jgi:hypothetical protein
MKTKRTTARDTGGNKMEHEGNTPQKTTLPSTNWLSGRSVLLFSNFVSLVRTAAWRGRELRSNSNQGGIAHQLLGRAEGWLASSDAEGEKFSCP